MSQMACPRRDPSTDAFSEWLAADDRRAGECNAFTSLTATLFHVSADPSSISARDGLIERFARLFNNQQFAGADMATAIEATVLAREVPCPCLSPACSILARAYPSLPRLVLCLILCLYLSSALTLLSALLTACLSLCSAFCPTCLSPYL